jgi:hypothetical protein
MGSKKKEDAEFLESINILNYPLLDLTLKMYLERCKFVHALVFLQFRRLIPCAPITAIKEMFEDRKEYLLMILDKVKELRLRKETKKQR